MGSVLQIGWLWDHSMHSSGRDPTEDTSLWLSVASGEVAIISTECVAPIFEALVQKDEQRTQILRCVLPKPTLSLINECHSAHCQSPRTKDQPSGRWNLTPRPCEACAVVVPMLQTLQPLQKHNTYPTSAFVPQPTIPNFKNLGVSPFRFRG